MKDSFTAKGYNLIFQEYFFRSNQKVFHMKPLFKTLLAVFTAIIIIISCQRIDDTEYFLSKVQADFPNKVGNQWTYLVKDNIQNIEAEVTVSIVGKTTIPTGEQATIWKYVYFNRIDTNYVVQLKDTIKVYEKYFLRNPNSTTYRGVLKKYYLYPLKLNNTWGSTLKNEIPTKVIEQKSITVKSGTYDKAFHLQTTGTACCNYSLSEDAWLTPGVGLLKLDRLEKKPAVSDDSSWELINCKLKEQ
ncbi:hypothetical protein SAMN04515674_11253 [Pseudarcicella hirudinis]|uniref:Uncharacterized protein n=2 Tax=Pseudarcicella hirudinis TaxID=1079859 RepID=A0A1I5WM79_9BACT|nr:hypothetical protein SAMN04515674_11253 [Pseudarcicella hirudinis]